MVVVLLVVQRLCSSSARAAPSPPIAADIEAWVDPLELSSEVVELGAAEAVADRSYLERFSLRGPGAWPLVAFRIEPSSSRPVLFR